MTHVWALRTNVKENKKSVGVANFVVLEYQKYIKFCNDANSLRQEYSLHTHEITEKKRKEKPSLLAAHETSDKKYVYKPFSVQID